MKRPVLFLFSLIFCISCLRAVAQDPGDSLKNIWEDQAMIDSLRFMALEAFVDRYEQSHTEEALENLEVYHDLAIEENQPRIFELSTRRRTSTGSRSSIPAGSTIKLSSRRSCLRSPVEGHCFRTREMCASKRVQQGHSKLFDALVIFQEKRTRRVSRACC